MANSLSVDGTDLSTHGLYVVRGSLPGMPDTVTSAMQVGQQDGAVSAPRIYGAREIVSDCVISAASYTAMLSAIDSIKGILNTREDVEVAWDRWADRYWLGRCQLSDIQLDSPTLARVQLRVFCSDPFAYGSSEATHNETGIDTGIGGTSFTVSAGSGTERAYPVIVLTATGTQASGTTLESNEQDTRIVYTGGLVSGDKLRIKCDPAEWIVEKMPAGEDTYVAVMEDVEGQWPYLSVGDNEFVIYFFTGSILFTWRARYL
jgi:predicted phage tail component-like protein